MNITEPHACEVYIPNSCESRGQLQYEIGYSGKDSLRGRNLKQILEGLRGLVKWEAIRVVLWAEGKTRVNTLCWEHI